MANWFEKFNTKLEARLADRMRRKLAMAREDYVKPERTPNRLKQLRAEKLQSAAYQHETMQLGLLVRHFLGRGYTLQQALVTAGKLADRFETHKTMFP